MITIRQITLLLLAIWLMAHPFQTRAESHATPPTPPVEIIAPLDRPSIRSRLYSAIEQTKRYIEDIPKRPNFHSRIVLVCNDADISGFEEGDYTRKDFWISRGCEKLKEKLSGCDLEELHIGDPLASGDKSKGANTKFRPEGRFVAAAKVLEGFRERGNPVVISACMADKCYGSQENNMMGSCSKSEISYMDSQGREAVEGAMADLLCNKALFKEFDVWDESGNKKSDGKLAQKEIERYLAHTLGGKRKVEKIFATRQITKMPPTRIPSGYSQFPEIDVKLVSPDELYDSVDQFLQESRRNADANTKFEESQFTGRTYRIIFKEAKREPVDLPGYYFNEGSAEMVAKSLVEDTSTFALEETGKVREIVSRNLNTPQLCKYFHGPVLLTVSVSGPRVPKYPAKRN